MFILKTPSVQKTATSYQKNTGEGETKTSEYNYHLGWH